VLACAALAFDIAIVGAYVVIFYAWEPDTPIRQALFLPVAEGAVRFGIAGGLIVPILLAPSWPTGKHCAPIASSATSTWTPSPFRSASRCSWVSSSAGWPHGFGARPPSPTRGQRRPRSYATG
ncbi:MAG TPA: hypothetical protein VJU01_04030, partial [Gaiellaceae bacterium]|nr:hypothetical protein [Gaiellaceae bacterium]